MNDSTPTQEDALDNASREEILSALFANMVIQQTNMAMMLLGKVAHPETGQFVQDVEASRMFIDQLEMIEAKTKGNLSKQEEGLLKQALAALHMAFVEAVDGGGAGASEAPTEQMSAPKPSPEQPQPSQSADSTATTATTAAKPAEP